MVVRIQVQVYEQDRDYSPDLSLCPLSWRPADHSWLDDEDLSEFVLGATEDQTVTRLTLQELKEVFDLATPLKTQKKKHHVLVSCAHRASCDCQIRPRTFTKITQELEAVRHLVS